MNSSAAGGSVLLMARARTFLERPHTFLVAAAESHARAVAGEPEPDDTTTEQEPAKPSAHSRSARRQRRSSGGTFTR